ncbi:MAG: tetratricopeptide repeat protein [Phycisphaerae bacterium]
MPQHTDLTELRRFEQLEALFFATLAQPVPGRAGFLDEVCGADAALRAEIERMLRADRDRGGVIDDDSWRAAQLAETLKPGAADDPLAAPGALIGGYRLHDRIGVGGMGTVWRAHRADDAFERTVAIKLIKRGMDSEEILRRFRLERQVLARLEHPNIARLYDAGETPDGRPYLVLEYIDGVPIDRHCRDHALDQTRVLELVRIVCTTVHFAHSNLVLHRDIKPGNVLVTRDGNLKLLDFGIAKLLDDGASSSTMTATHSAFTPRYASPEQIRGERLSTASDVYSLGVLLFELLTGEWPYGSQGGGRRELEQLICEHEPPRPSQVLVHRSDPPSGRRHVDADLDGVILKCLAKHPADRYTSAGDLAAEITRYLDYQPVLARRPGLATRTRKFLRRNRRSVWAGAVVSLALLAATAISIRSAARESQQRFAAERAQQRAEEQGRLAADRALEAAQQADIARAVAAFLNEDLLASVAPSAAPGEGRDVALRDVLDAASARIEAAAQPGGRFFDKPLVEAEIRETLADTYAALTEYAPAEHHLTRALDIRRSAQGEHHPQVLQTTARYGMLLCQRGRLAEAAPLVHAALLGCRSVLGDTAPQTLAAMEVAGSWLQAIGRYPEALAQFQETYAGLCDALGPDHPRTFASAAKLGSLLQAMGRLVEAEPFLRIALEGRRRSTGDQSPETLSSLHNMGTLLVALGRYDDALGHLHTALERRRRTCGPDHVDTLHSEHETGDLLKKMGRYAEALPHFQAALDGCRRALGDDHSLTLSSLRGLAAVLQYLARYAEAEPHMRASLEAARAQLGPDHPAAIDALASLGSLLFSMGRPEQAEPILREAADRHRRALGDDHPSTLDSVNNLAAVLRQLRRFDEAEPLVREALERRRRTLGDDHPSTLYSLNTLGVLLINMRRFDEAEPYVRETYERRRDTLGADHPSTLTARMNLAGLFDQSGRPGASLPHHLAVLESRRRVLGEDHPDTVRSCSVIASLLEKLERPGDALDYSSKAVAGARRSLPVGHVGIGAYLAGHGKLLTRLARFTEAESVLLEAHSILEAAGAPEKKRVLWVRGLLRDLYAAWHQEEPALGYDQKARLWENETP